MNCVQELEGCFREYDQAVAELQKNRKMLDGVLGLGNHPGNAACHDMLDRQVAELCQRVGAEETEPGERLDLIRGIFEAERKWKGPEYARLMLIAIQRHTVPLIGELSAQDRQELAAWYEKSYPRRNRLPVQEEVLTALQGSEKKKHRKIWG